MTPAEYILSTLEVLSKPVPTVDISEVSLKDAVYSKVMSKKFRKLKPADLCVNLTKKAIEIAISENKPIRIVEMFGGNKLWRFNEAPEIDWAELFSLTFFIQWSRLIASVYEPGVIFEYLSQDISVESLNNVPRHETDKYSESFRELIKFVEPYLPPNISVKYTRHFELFDNPDDYYDEMISAKEEVLKENNGNLPVLTDVMKAATELNVKLKPAQSDDPLWREKVELEHQAIFKTKTLRVYCDSPDIIWTCPTFYPDCVVTGSTKRSMAKFWAAVGVLQEEKEEYAELVLTPKQLGSAIFNWEEIEIKGLEGRNFKKIRILR